MSKIDYQALREKAEKATCGVWSLEYGEGRFDGDDALIHREVAGYIPICRIEGAHPESGFDEDFQTEQQANAEFIAAANPATVLALLDERERNQQYIKRRDQENEEIALMVGKLRVDLEAAENNLIDSECHVAELEEALRDKQALLEASEKRIAELEAEPVSQTYKLNKLAGNSPVTPDGWISCSERMPEDTKMLLAFSQGEIVAAYWNWVVNPVDYKKYRAFTYLSGNILDDVTHWMPLPEPPQEVNP
ncbi:ead/Ea22-like family protein [Escherichia coli]|uniref:ead/Ea22-like family protein n=1 Tax=Escherichia coli TaxID=562 RepID=UPI001D5541C0|nr:ead/Ea22-like family protein [Escherichia coli]EHO9798480.1 ead/Ea22-like family protein [Escherichia coli]EHU4169471.1 ead/Ea22-like family protein [Escherichia coli]EIS9998428.1 ead/Ea22-like family protein [Escherichia coli]EJG5811430.1 ead/Ea22-like family protein [Escherichia coli]